MSPQKMAKPSIRGATMRLNIRYTILAIFFLAGATAASYVLFGRQEFPRGPDSPPDVAKRGAAPCSVTGVLYSERSELEDHCAVKSAPVGKNGEPVCSGRGNTLFSSTSADGVADVALSHSGECVLISGNKHHPYTEQGGRVWLVSRKTDEETALTDKASDSDQTGYINLQWSPDDSMISYVTDEVLQSGNRSDEKDPNVNVLYAQDVETRERRRLLHRTMSSAWLPGSRKLLCTSQWQKGLILVDADTGDTSVIRDAPAGSIVFLSSAGNGVAWVHGTRLCVARLSGDAAKVDVSPDVEAVSEFELPSQPAAVSFSPDGKKVALLIPVDGPQPGLLHQAAILEPAARQVRILGTVGEVYPGASAFGYPLGIGFYRSRQLTHVTSGRDLRWSRDGRYIMTARDLREYIALAVNQQEAVPVSDANWLDSRKAKVLSVLSCPTAAQIEWVTTR